MTDTNLLAAHRQWASRPADERFQSVEALLNNARASRANGRPAAAKWGELEVALTSAGAPVLVGKSGGHAALSNWAFRQLASRVGAPARYLEKLPADLASDCLNAGIAGLSDPEAEARLLLDGSTGRPTVRALTSDSYSRIWDADIIERLSALGGGWKLPLGYANGQWGAELVPSGAYRGDRDFFLFLVNEDRKVNDGSAEGLSRGFFVWNSEVGAKTFGVSTFLYRHVCGNNIVWGASQVAEARLRHVGDASAKAFAELDRLLQKYADAPVAADEAAIAKAQAFSLGTDEETVVEKVVALTGTTAKLARESYRLGETWASVDSHPSTGWGAVNAITRYAQLSQWADERVEVEGVAAKLMGRIVA